MINLNPLFNDQEENLAHQEDEESEDDYMGLNRLFNSPEEKVGQQESTNMPLEKVLSEAFTWYFLPNNILTEEPNKRKPNLNIAKFKEYYGEKVMEDMIYYCSPIDVLSKIDVQNTGEPLCESESEFVDDLGIVSFFQNHYMISTHMNAEYKVDKIINTNNLKDWKDKLENKDKPIDKNIVNKSNKILQIIQNIMKNLAKKKMAKNDIIENLDKVISESKNNEINLENIGFKLFMILENNLLFLFGLIIKFFGKEEEIIVKLLEKYIELFNILKSNRLFFAIIEYLNNNKNISEKINIEKSIELISKKCINFSEIIKFIDHFRLENTLHLPNLSIDTQCSKENNNENSSIQNDYWVVNTSEEILIFKVSQKQNKSILRFYRINIRISEVNTKYYDMDKETDGDLRLIDFGEIELEDKIFDINISIKNDLIYVFYFINQKLNKSENEEKELEFGLAYKIFTTSMTRLKEGLIENDHFKHQKSNLYSDKDNLYVIINDNKILATKKEYSMNSFEIKELSVNCENKTISILDYKYHNNFNLENLLILENKNDINDILLAEIYKENNKYIFKLVSIESNVPKDDFRYKISYNNNIFTFTKIKENKIHFYFSDPFDENFSETGLRFLPFDTKLKKDIFNIEKNTDKYKKLLKDYIYIINLYGNFDKFPLKKIALTEFPFSLCFNINVNNLNFIIEQLLNTKDMEIYYYYLIFLKEYICCLYNTNLFKIEMFEKVLPNLKNFIMNIKTNKENQYKIKILKEIIYISIYFNDNNIIEITDVEKILSIKDDEKDLKINLLLLDLLFTQPKTRLDIKLFDLICEFDKIFLEEFYQEKIELKKENKIISFYFSLYKKVMLKAMSITNNYFLKKDNELFSYLKKISENIIYICNLYKNICNTYRGKMPFLFYSFNFMFYFLIIQRRTMNKTFNKDFEIFSSVYNALISLDKLNINYNMNKVLDLNNIIEITNSRAESEIKKANEEDNFNEINFKYKQNIVFRSNLINYVNSVDLSSYFKKILLITKDKDSKEIKTELDLNHCIDQIFYDIYGLEIYFKENIEYKWRAIIDIIPVKDVKLYLENKYNENYKIINIVQKTILYYFLFLFKDVNNKINTFFKIDKIKNFCKFYHNEFLQFIDTNNINIDPNLFDKKNDISTKEKEDDESTKDVLPIIDDFTADLKYSLNLDNNEKDKESNTKKSNINLIMELLNKLISFFVDINKGQKNLNNFQSYYNKGDISLNQIKSYKEINLEDKSYEKLFEQLEKDIAKKNRLLSSMKSNESIKKLILKIFQIIIKYYNYNSKFFDLIKSSDFSNKNEDYKLFLEIYEKCCQMKMVYNQEKSRFVDEKFEEQSENYFKVTNAKLDFLHKIIIPSFNENLKYDKYIVQNLIELIKNENFDPKELLKYSEIQNINCTFIAIELLIINNLLLNLNDEENIKLILHVVNDIYNKNKEHNRYSISVSVLDSIYGADYSQMLQVKNHFHLLIGIIIEKFICNKSNYKNLGIISKILLYQCLLWKYKGRDFIIMQKILNCFQDLKKGEFDKDKNIFDLKHEKVFRINNYNLESFNDIKFEIFKIISSQIFWRIKDNLENNSVLKEENNLDLNLKRTLSIINNQNSILNSLMSYLSEIKITNKYYYDIILFFYKNIINSKNLISTLNTSSFYDVIVKIFKIIFDDENTDKNNKINIKRNNYTKFITLKLFLQILENIDNEDKIANLFECYLDYNKNIINENDEESNIFKYLVIKFNSLLKKENIPFLKHYYLKIFLFCLNKIDKSEIIIEKNELLDINFLLSLNDNLNQLESKFYIKNNKGDEFEKITLFSNDENVKMGKKGNLISYMENKNFFSEFIINTDINYFDYDDFVYNVYQIINCEYIMVIMDDTLEAKIISKINNLDCKEIKDIVLIPGQNNNLFSNKYLEKNSGYIFDKLIEKLIEDKLNYKGINYILKMVQNLLDYISQENADKLIKYIFKYITDKNVEENKKEWDFCSYEYFINEKNSFKNLFYSSSFDIDKEIKINQKSNEEINKKIKTSKEAPLLLSSLFNYVIKNNKDLYIEYKSNSNINNSFLNELTLVNTELYKDNKDINMSNLSFYKSNTINDSTLITENSLLIINKLCPDNELLNLLSENSGKIKAIIFSEIDKKEEEENNQFLTKIKVPIFLVTINFYLKFSKFFIEGNGGNYLNTNKTESDLISIYIPNLYLPLKKSDKEKDKKEKEYSTFYIEEDLCLDSLFSENTSNNHTMEEERKNEYLDQYKKCILKKYEELNFDRNKVFCIENIKLCHRILYELLQKENIINKVNKEILSNNNFDLIMNIFDSLCKEYYFNIKQNLPIHNLQSLLKNFLKSLGKLYIFGQKWVQNLIKHIFDIMNSSNKEETNVKEDKSEKMTASLVHLKLKEALELNNIYFKDKNEIQIIKNIEKKPKEKEVELILEKCKKCDLLLFIFKHCNDLILDMNSINYCFEIIMYILEDSENKNRLKMINKEFIPYFLYEWMDSIHNIIVNNKPNSKLLIEFLINNNNFNDLMLKFINEVIEIKNYFIKDGRDRDKDISKSKTLLVQFGCKYLDICFYVFFKEKRYNSIKYWLKSNSDFYQFYSSYKILATDNHYEENDLKELLTLIAYISNSISCFEKRNNEKNRYLSEKKVQIKGNEFNKIKLNFKNDSQSWINLTSFSIDDLEKSKDNTNNKFKKLAIFSYNKSKDIYNLQDIIDISDLSSDKPLKKYLQIFNKEDIYLVPLNNISTSLYAFGNNFNHSLGINGKLAKFYDKPTKCIGLPNNIWNIGYGNNYCLALCEDNNTIYACGCNKGGGFNSTPRATFTDDTKINKNKNSDVINKFINFATGNCDSTLLIDENGELYGIGNNEEKIFGFENEQKIKYPKKLNMDVYTKKEERVEEEKKEEEKIKNEIKDEEKIGKIKSFHIGYKNSYIINEEGKLFGIGNNEYFQISSDDNKILYEKWKNIPLPENCNKFVDVAVGESYILCLIEDNEGNNKLYARGRNNDNQCGIITREKNVKYLTMIDYSKNLNFKKIYTRNNQSAAITVEGDLYILNGSQLTLAIFDEKKDLKNNNESDKIKENSNKNEIKDINEIKEENENIEDNKIIVDDVAISMSHMLIIARQYDKEKGIYVRKLFGLGCNSKGALGLPINSNKDENSINSITEIPLFDENNKKLTPVKLTIGDNKSYVLCVNEEELIQNIKSNQNKENEKYNINISDIYIKKTEKSILDFYYSKNVELFINIFKSITSKALSNFIEALDDIKMSEQEKFNKNNDILFSIDFPIFYDYLSKNQKLSDLFHIFIQTNISEKDLKINLNTKPELQSIFNYLKSKSNFITSDLFKYCETNEKSESKQFLQKAIGNNLLYLSAQVRLDKFNELFSKLHRKYGTERRIEVDRFKANTFYDKFNESEKTRIPDLDLNQTIFGQVFQKFNNTRADEYLIHKDKRLFVVCLQNEYASDSGGPYHEVISGMCQELQSEYLNMFIKSPNNKHDIGLLRDKFIPNPDAKRKIYEEGYEFLGKLMASSISSGEALDLNLHPIVWQGLLGNEITFYDYENIDYTFFSLINNLEKELKPENEQQKEKKENEITTNEIKENVNNQLYTQEEMDNFQDKYNLNFVIKNSNESDIILKPDGDKIPVTLENLKEYISLSKKMRTAEFNSQIECIKKGFNAVIDSSILQHLYWRQLEEMVCGKATLDIRTFMKNTKYDGFQKDDEVIKWFWEWLGKCNDHEQSLYLKFVSGRTRLPKEPNFKYTHTIQRNSYNGNESFPQSATCFFTLKLPAYNDRETLEKKMNYSILNCDEIDGDN